ncbi:DUF4226 domain-containing protein [Mycobacterium ulcerans]|uniref:DUF4226 domain-containing protein n=1 Tax=Mycobacterium ulcerans TaxID=1809 RepID=UPI0012DE0EFF|nr:DUF4226 domain-containing protein [Mycobacterium ulcerans]MEB3967394.1 DUF4226 domain-containing protein [Mycobacterium ulcerans]MEB3975748.1 DUF4226 domain-containing protein [Mycobacterium ulcerans]MEB4004997.1 DUF4226 domain-containing protein [Mycobacterium ulcerans]MEB4414481.1 DUF4226 domain-containing protein [Mycobacterium ulcerans]MEB4432649.1 DUF4226 domain-containing protein [Mycobacterium ulcerans]
MNGGEPRSEQAGSALAAIRARQAELARQHDVLGEADRALVEALTRAHTVMRDSVRRLDAIGAEIDGAVAVQDSLALDTPLGAREFQNFLLAKQREIATIVATAHELDRTKSAVLANLRAHYGESVG